MTESPAIFPPSSLTEVLERLASLDTKQIDALRADIRQHGFDARKERCEFLSQKSGLSAETVAVVLSAFAFLYARTNAMELTQAVAAITKLLDDADVPTLSDDNVRQKLATAVAEIVAPSSEIDVSRKVARLKAGFLRNAVGFATFVDIRPDFTDDNSEIRALIPLIQFRITTDADLAPEKNILFQIDPAGLKALKEAIGAAEKKIETLMKSGGASRPFHKIAE